MNNTMISQLQGGKYQVDSLIGSGGFGNTYLATQVSLGRKVAIKEFFMKEFCERDNHTSCVIVPTEASRQLVDRYKQKFLKEAQMIASLKNEHIIQIYDIFEENNTAYYVMEYVSCGSLKDKVDIHGALSEDVAIRYISQVSDALSYLHSNNILHLDIKPSNILLDDQDKVILIDFGISKHYDSEGEQTSTTPAGVSKGYAPIEQYQMGNSVITFSPSTDIYALGATMYKLLTGKTPGDATRLLNEGLPELPTSISEQVRNAIVVSMKPMRRDRPQSIKEFESILYAPNIGDLKSTGYTNTGTESEDTIIVSNDSTIAVGSMRDTDKQESSKILEASDEKKQKANFKQYIKVISAKSFIIFLLIHLIITFLSVIDTFRGTYGAMDGIFQDGCDFMLNPVIGFINLLLSIGFVVYVVQTIISLIKYKSSSKSLITFGILILVFLVFHLNHFWAEMQLKEFMGEHSENPYLLLDMTFRNWWIVAFYILWIGTLGFYIVNDFENILKVSGWDNKIRIIKDQIVKPKTMAYSLSIIVCFGFIVVAINAYMHANGLLL